jgi:NhaP-type Na+/H+ or K+/H+ antiporter
MLAPTDAALGEEVVSDKRLPAWLRQGLNVESGLNDGLSVPVFLVLIIMSTAHSWSPGLLGAEVLRQVGFGLCSGLAVGGIGGLLVRIARQRGLMLGEWARLAVLAIALASYVGAASVFVAAAGTGAAWQTKAFMGWFGPRGLATVVFTVLLFDEAVPNKEIVAAVAVTGVVLSVYAHGFTAPWLVGVYSKWYDAHGIDRGTSPEQREVKQPALRSANVAQPKERTPSEA